MKIKSLIFLGVMQCFFAANAQVKTLDPVEYVNPLMGTQSLHLSLIHISEPTRLELESRLPG